MSHPLFFFPHVSFAKLWIQSLLPGIIICNNLPQEKNDIHLWVRSEKMPSLNILKRHGGRERLLPKEVTQRPIQHGQFQAWGIHSLPGKWGPDPHHPLHRTMSHSGRIVSHFFWCLLLNVCVKKEKCFPWRSNGNTKVCDYVLSKNVWKEQFWWILLDKV